MRYKEMLVALTVGEATLGQCLAYRECGGAALIGVRLAEDLGRVARRSVVWTPSEGRARKVVLSRKVDAATFDDRAMSSNTHWNRLRANMTLWRSLRSRSVDLVHVHCPYMYAIHRWAFAWYGAKTVVHVHIEMPEDVLQWVFASPPDMIITCASFLRDQVSNVISQAGAENARIVAVPNSVDEGLFSPGCREEARRAVELQPKGAVLLMLANLAPHKGHGTAIRTVHELKHRGVPVELWCAGVEREGGDYTNKLQALTEELGVSDCVRFLGFRDDSVGLLRASDVLLLPSTREGLPLTVLEAQACEVPVVANAVAGVPEVVVDGETGFVVDHDDVKGYADRIELLLTNPELTREITTRASSQISANHTWNVYRKKMLDCYSELLAKQPV